MAEQGLSQDEVWDDSALLDSWNEALEEYKKYHSLAVKGEMVKLNATQPEEGTVNGDTPSEAQVEMVTESTSAQDLPAGDPISAKAQPNGMPSFPALPQALLGNVSNEDLRNLMMSWYYAGYYTGLYEGKQQGYASAMQGEGG